MSRFFALSILLATCFLLLTTAHVNAQSACVPLYGGGPTCEKHPDFEIDKKVLDPQTKKYIDNITIVNTSLPIDQTLTFRITIRNTTERKIDKIALTDTLPSALKFKSGNGKYDQTSRTFSDSFSLEKGQSKVYTIAAEVNLDNLQNKTACSINQAVLTQDNKNGSDYVKVCINISQANKGGSNKEVAGQTTSKGGLPVFSQKAPKKTPDTGPEAVGFLSLPLMAGLGYLLRKKTFF